MKKIKLYSYLLMFAFGFDFFVMIFSRVLFPKIVINVVVFIAFVGYLSVLETYFFKPIEKACHLDDEEDLERVMAKEIWESHKDYFGVINEKIKGYIHDEIAGLNIEMLRKKMEYTALQSQINPHFLYNTLETIRSQAITEGDKEIAEMVERLSSIFRYSISRKGEVVTLRDELNNIRNYMKIMEFRFYDRFSLEIDIDEEDGKVFDFYIPRLILQPIVENAINHGLDETVTGGVVRIEVVLVGDMIITISDNGKGMSLQELDSLNQKIHSSDQIGKGVNANEQNGTGIALANVHKRIQLLYGKEYGLNVYSSEKCGTDVELMLPIIDKMENGIIGKDAIKGE